jgi:hypothetical protein
VLLVRHATARRWRQRIGPAGVGDDGWVECSGVIGAADLRLRGREREVVERGPLRRRDVFGSDDTPRATEPGRPRLSGSGGSNESHWSRARQTVKPTPATVQRSTRAASIKTRRSPPATGEDQKIQSGYRTDRCSAHPRPHVHPQLHFLEMQNEKTQVVVVWWCRLTA